MEPQLTPAGVDVTVPKPNPAFLTVSVLSLSNTAVAERSVLMVRLQVPVPEQSPNQPVKEEPAAGLAVSVTGAAAKGDEHVDPQLIPAGLVVTVPDPDPAFVTVSLLPR